MASKPAAVTKLPATPVPTPHATVIAERLRGAGVDTVTIAMALGESVSVVTRWFELADELEEEHDGASD